MLVSLDDPAKRPTRDPLVRGGYLSDPQEIQQLVANLRAPMLDVVIVLATTLVDLFRSRRSLLAEITLLRHQRSVARPRVTRFDRIALVALAAVMPTWRNVLRIVQPETLLRWHRAGFKALWRWRTRTSAAPRLAPETAVLIRSMASANRLWGAERIRGELLKLGLKVSKRTIQRYCARRGRAGREGSAGKASYETMPTRSGLATSCKPTTCSSARSSRLCLSKSPPEERNHQGLGNVIPFPSHPLADARGPIRRRERLGGLLNSYERSAA
jgi:hypothetical protein